MEANTDKNGVISGIRKKTRKALRPGFGESNIGMGGPSTSRLSLISMEKHRPDESSPTPVLSKQVTAFKEGRPNSANEDENVTRNLGTFLNCSLGEKKSEIRSSIMKKNFKEDLDQNNMVGEDIGKRGNPGSSGNCPFLVGSGSEASYERSSEAHNVIKSLNDLKLDYGRLPNEDFSLKDLVSNLSVESMDMEELSKWFSNVMIKFETFGLNTQSRLEKLEHEIEMSDRELKKHDPGDGENRPNEQPGMSEKYCELLRLKDRLIKELSEVENEIMLEELRIKREENEKKIRLQGYKDTIQVYKEELSSLTVVICWIEDCLQKYIYPIQRKQSELKQKANRDSDVVKLIQEEILKIEKQEKVVLEKIREIQEAKRYKSEEKEMLEEQIRLSQASKSDKIKNANFKEASLISQTIQVLQQEVLELDEDFSGIIHQEKEFVEKIERIRRNRLEEIARLHACKQEVIANRKEKRQELKLELQNLRSCEFSFNSDNFPESIASTLRVLSESFSEQIKSVLSFEFALINNQDLEDDLEQNRQELRAGGSSGKVLQTESSPRDEQSGNDGPAEVISAEKVLEETQLTPGEIRDKDLQRSDPDAEPPEI
ncbi:myosin II heavy chain, non muscle [Cryptosporidium felis]|nr:myosin II heavy chain, non muscle [Cryptosporidium felis]